MDLIVLQINLIGCLNVLLFIVTLIFIKLQFELGNLILKQIIFLLHIFKASIQFLIFLYFHF
jgi:hypothetical protein